MASSGAFAAGCWSKIVNKPKRCKNKALYLIYLDETILQPEDCCKSEWTSSNCNQGRICVWFRGTRWDHLMAKDITIVYRDAVPLTAIISWTNIVWSLHGTESGIVFIVLTEVWTCTEIISTIPFCPVRNLNAGLGFESSESGGRGGGGIILKFFQ
jgi:hypothetical protein